MRIIGVRPRFCIMQYRISVIRRSDGPELRLTFCVACAMMSSTGHNALMLLSAIPPRADFFKKERRLLWDVSALLTATGSGSFRPSLVRICLDGVIWDDLMISILCLFT